MTAGAVSPCLRRLEAQGEAAAPAAPGAFRQLAATRKTTKPTKRKKE